MNTVRTLIYLFVVALLVSACAPEPLEQAATPAVRREAPESPGELIARATDAMSQQRGFRGGFAQTPLQQEARFNYASPDLMLVEDFGGDFEDHVLVAGKDVFVSSDGKRWRASPELTLGFATFFSATYDPRTSLRYGQDPQFAGDEDIQGKAYTVVQLKLDAERLVSDHGGFVPSIRLSLRFSPPPEGDRQALKKLGYEVFVTRHSDSSSSELFKDR